MDIIRARNTVMKIEKLREGRSGDIINKINPRIEELKDVDQSLIWTGTPRNPGRSFLAGLELEGRSVGNIALPELGASWTVVERALLDILLDVPLHVRYLVYKLYQDPNFPF